MEKPSEKGVLDPDEGFDEDGDDEERKVWVRNHRTGDLGWLVTKDGRQYVHLDRPMVANLIEYDKQRWDVEPERRPLTRYQLAAVAFEADQSLCKSMGIQVARKPWSLMTPDERMLWRDRGPAPNAQRSPRGKLWSSIMQGMKGFVQ